MFSVLVKGYIYMFVLGRPLMVRGWALKHKIVSDTVENTE